MVLEIRPNLPTEKIKGLSRLFGRLLFLNACVITVLRYMCYGRVDDDDDDDDGDDGDNDDDSAAADDDGSTFLKQCN